MKNDRRRVYLAWLLNNSQSAAPDPPIEIAAWFEGSNTTLSIAASRARCARNGTDNPRISRAVSGLVGGATYRITSNVYVGTSGNVFFRAHATQPEMRNAPYLLNTQFLTDGAFDSTFVAPLDGICYIGIVPVAGSNGIYGETDEDFTIVRVA